MKVFCVILAILGCSAAAYSQKLPGDVSEDVRSSEKIIQGAPFTANAVTESVQVLADGTKIVRRAESLLYRDKVGRFRREDGPRQLGVPGAVVDLAESAWIIDPIAGSRFRFDLEKKEAFLTSADAKFTLNTNSEWKLSSSNNSSSEMTKKIERGQDAKNQQKPTPSNASEKPKRVDGENVKTEALGKRDIEGVLADGIRRTTTIPAGGIGNDRDFYVVYERWYSSELQMTVLSKYSDPRFGEQTYRLTNIRRDNPPLSLFQVPGDFRLFDRKNRISGPRKPDAPTEPRVKKAPRVPKQGSEPKSNN